MARDQIEIANNSIDKIQNQYLAESKINKIFYDDRYYQEQILPSIMNHNDKVNRNHTYTLEQSDIFFDDNNRVNGRFYDLDGKRYIELSTISEYQGITTPMKAYGTVFNDIFNEKNPALSYNTINVEHLDKFNLFMNGIRMDSIDIDTLPDSITAMELYNYEQIRVENGRNQNYRIITKYFTLEEEDISINNNQQVFMIVGNPQSNINPEVQIKDDVFFRGILYIEGDLVIKSPFWFLGIIIVKGDIIIDEDLVKKPRIDGAILYNGELNLNNWDLRHHITYLNLFGIYLPNFIEPKLQVYQYMEGN